MSLPYNSKSGDSYPTNAPNFTIYATGRNIARSQLPTTRFTSPTQSQHNHGSQQIHGHGKENHPSAYYQQAESSRAQILEMGPAVLQNSMANNVHCGGRNPNTAGLVGHVQVHPTLHDSVSGSCSGNASTPVAQRYTVPVLSYQSNPSNQRQGPNSVLISGEWTSHEFSSVTSSTRQQSGFNSTPIAGSARYPPYATHAQAGTEVDLDMDCPSPALTRSFYASYPSPEIVRPGISTANRAPLDPGQSDFFTPCPPPSPEVQRPFLPQIHIPSTVSNTSSHATYSPGSRILQPRLRLWRPCSTAASKSSVHMQSSTRIGNRSNDGYNSAMAAVNPNPYSLRIEGDANKTPTQTFAGSRYASSSNSHNREGSVTPTQRQWDSQQPFPHTNSDELLQGSIMYDSRWSSVPQTLAGESSSSSPLFDHRSRYESSPERLGHHAIRRRSVRRNTVTNSQFSDKERIGSRNIPSRPRASSLSEHAAPFIPGQQTHSNPCLPPDSVTPEETDSDRELETADDDFKKYVEWFLDAFMTLDDIMKEMIFPNPISSEDITTHTRSARQGVLPLLPPADATRSVEACIGWLESQRNSRKGIMYLSRYLAVSLCMTNGQRRVFESKCCYYFFSLLIGNLKENIRERFGACLFEECVRFVEVILKADIPAGTSESQFPLFFWIGHVQITIIGTLFKLGLVSTTKIMKFLWFLLEGRPHRARITNIFHLITAAGEKICVPSNHRQIGDFLTTLHRIYVVPPPGGLLPDVFLAPKKLKQPIFDFVRSLLQRIRMLIAQWRLSKEFRKERKEIYHMAAWSKNTYANMPNVREK
ncbi:hypothetical protein J3R30DRAFT_3510316 [Lentinula aciculospora]|uniref:Uncharacterized protein n=1 Tax=Lentinula aciculospora TaxID=153920 RepID=A0A9W9A3W3_9AGAR|nr:hypothetical protein J3R30DRAFT_3510316 [Lentinula aciculospora]